jgi:hypothetical protein
MSPWFDSRYHLLHYLDVPVEPPIPQRISKLCNKLLEGHLPSVAPLEKAQQLRSAMHNYLAEVAVPMGFSPPVLNTLSGQPDEGDL